MARQVVMLNRTELHSTSDIAKADDIGFQEITENAAKSMENLIEQLEGTSSESLPTRDRKRGILAQFRPLSDQIDPGHRKI